MQFTRWFEEDTKDMKTPIAKDLTESMQMLTRKSIDSNGVLCDVHLCGLTSDNGYTYKESALKEAVKLYEDVDVYSNHAAVKGPRKQEDKIGFIKGSARFVEGKGNFGDIQFNTEHPTYKATKWWVENAPKKLGMSHIIGGDFSEDENAVTKIKIVKSVDLVSTPATTAGMFMEGLISDAIEKDQEKNRLYNTISKAWSLMWDTVYPLSGALTDEEKAVKLGPIVQDLTQELLTFTTSKTESKDDTMKDLAELKAKFPALYEEALAEGKKVIATNNTAAIEAAKNDGVKEGAKKERELIQKMEAAIKDIPADKRSNVFMKQIRESLEKGEDVTELVEDRKNVLGKQPESTGQHKGKTEVAEKSESKIDDDAILNAVGSK